jgi:hypothetical protein
VSSDALHRVSTGVLSQLGAPTADDLEAIARLARIEAALTAKDGGA